MSALDLLATRVPGHALPRPFYTDAEIHISGSNGVDPAGDCAPRPRWRATWPRKVVTKSGCAQLTAARHL